MNQEVINQAEWKNPENWAGPQWASLYFSKSDSRIIVPRHLRKGWTLNLGKNKSVAWLVVILLTLSLAALSGSLFAFRAIYGSSSRALSSISLFSRNTTVPLNFLSDIPGLSKINSGITEHEFRQILGRQPLQTKLAWHAKDSSVTYSIDDPSGHRAELTFQDGTCISIRRLPDKNAE